jgi:protein SCO1/2
MLRTAVACIAFAACAGWSGASLTHGFQVWTEEGARRLEVALSPVDTPRIQVQAEDGRVLNLRALLADGRGPTLVEFFYTRCRTVCLSQGGSFQQMQAALRASSESSPSDPRVRLLSISFDWQGDSPRALADYARRMGADAAAWRFVRASDAADARKLLDAFRVVVVPDGRGDYLHNAALLAVNSDGRLLRVFDLAEHQLALDYARHLAAGGAP